LKTLDLQVGKKAKNMICTIDAENQDTRSLNQNIRDLIKNGEKRILIKNVTGQRYLAAGLTGNIEIEIFGTPGNDLGAFMDGPKIEVHGNGQDCIGNTMGGGKLIIHGDVGDITGMSMRGGRILIEGDSGYRTGVHCKGVPEKEPSIVIGGEAQDFLGEYMAGGTILVLGLNLKDNLHPADFVGTGMHGGIIYIRGEVLGTGKEVEILEVDKKDKENIKELVEDYSKYFHCDVKDILKSRFKKLIPKNSRPYGKLYAY
jgi:glutamate synthase domain-containing protein 3